MTSTFHNRWIKGLILALCLTLVSGNGLKAAKIPVKYTRSMFFFVILPTLLTSFERLIQSSSKKYIVSSSEHSRFHGP